MLSGIGPADHLRKIGCGIHHDLPGVGQNLQDHPTVSISWECLQKFKVHQIDQPIPKVMAGINWMLTRKGLAASNHFEAGGLICGNRNVNYPNLQYHFAPAFNEYDGRKIILSQGFLLQCDQLRPKSKGRVRLKSNNPSESPDSFFNYLSHPHDIIELREAFKKMIELIAQPAFNEFRGKRIKPSPDIKNDSDIDQWIRETATTDYHPSGTCKMGKGPDAVVDENLKVHGFENLYVVDASVMPDVVSANLNAPTQMIAEKASDIILNKKPLNPIEASFHFQNI